MTFFHSAPVSVVATVTIGLLGVYLYNYYFVASDKDSSSRRVGPQSSLPTVVQDGNSVEDDDDVDDEADIPDDLRDPISLQLMLDPVVLSATGQVYDYNSLKSWFSTGSRHCPKTNTHILDIHIVRVPTLRDRVHQYLQSRGRRMPPDPTPPPEAAAALHPELPGWIRDLRRGDSNRANVAVARINDLLVDWKSSAAQNEDDMNAKQKVLLEHVMDDMIWLVRYGTAYSQGVAAAILSFCSSLADLSWFGAVATVPITQLLFSPDKYAQHSAARVLAKLAAINAGVQDTIWRCGGVAGLLEQLRLPQFPYCKSHVATALWALSVSAPCREEMLACGVINHLIHLYHSTSNRYELRDSAAVLLRLLKVSGGVRGIKPDEIARMRAVRWCSSAWLLGQVEEPYEGYTAAELERLRKIREYQRAWLRGRVARLVQPQQPQPAAVAVDAQAQHGADDNNEAAEAADAEDDDAALLQPVDNWIHALGEDVAAGLAVDAALRQQAAAQHGNGADAQQQQQLRNGTNDVRQAGGDQSNAAEDIYNEDIEIPPRHIVFPHAPRSP